MGEYRNDYDRLKIAKEFKASQTVIGPSELLSHLLYKE